MEQDLYVVKDRSYFGAVKMGVFNRVPEKRFGRVLDIGGGDAASARYVIDNGFASSVIVLDPYADFESNCKLGCIKRSADDLSVHEGFKEQGIQFDTVFCFDVLEHLFNPWAVLEAACQNQVSGGRLLVSMPNARFVAMTMPLLLFGRFDYKDSGIMDRTHIRWFTRATTIELVESAGYRVDKVDAIIEPRVKLANLLTLGLLRRFFEYQYIVQATKK